jgi:hypothetical protein
MTNDDVAEAFLADEDNITDEVPANPDLLDMLDESILAIDAQSNELRQLREFLAGIGEENFPRIVQDAIRGALNPIYYNALNFNNSIR